MNEFWPIGLLLFSNVMYNILAKNLPENLNPIAANAMIYAIGVVLSFVLYSVLMKDANFVSEVKNANWTIFALAACIVGMEIGTFYLYRVGWPISVGMMMSNGCMAVLLLLVGYFFYHEAITFTKLAGMICILGGVFLVNK